MSTEVLRRTVRTGDSTGSKGQRCSGPVFTVSADRSSARQVETVGDEAAEAVPLPDALLERLRRAPDWEHLPFAGRLRRIRKARDWSLLQLAGRMVLVGGKHRGRTAKARSLKIMISGWEHGERVPDDRNRRLLADALGCQVADLGLTVDPDVIW